MDKEFEVTLNLDEAVRALVAYTGFDIMLCKAVLKGENVTDNLGMLRVNNDNHEIIYNQIEDVIENSRYAGAYMMYRKVYANYLKKIDELMLEAIGETDENCH